MDAPQQQQRAQKSFANMTPQGKKALLLGLMFYPSLSVQIFARLRTGLRLLKIPRVISLTALMCAFALIASWITASGPAISVKGFLGRIATPSTAAAPEQQQIQQSTTPQPGYDAPLPPEWPRMNFYQRNVWGQRHQLSPQKLQEQREQAQRQAQEQELLQEKAQAEAQAKAADAARLSERRASPLPMLAYAFLFLIAGLWQHHARWIEILAGVKWHTMSRGTSVLMPLLGKKMPEDKIIRFADGLAVFLLGCIVFYFNRPLGAWLLFCSGALLIVEQMVFDEQLNADLDMLDSLVDADSMKDTLRIRKQGDAGAAQPRSPSIEENGGMLSTAAIVPDLVARREKREGRALRRKQADDDFLDEMETMVGAELPKKPNGSPNAAAAPLPEDDGPAL